MIRTPCPKDSIASRSMAPERYRKEGIMEAREIEGGREGGRKTYRQRGREAGRERESGLYGAGTRERASEPERYPDKPAALGGCEVEIEIEIEREGEGDRERERESE
jgi:hypothetical protein